MDDIYTRFWNKYRLKTEACNISDADHQCYIKHVNAFINAHPEQAYADTQSNALRDKSPAHPTLHITCKSARRWIRFA